jgi:hypothetical protein
MGLRLAPHACMIEVRIVDISQACRNPHGRLIVFEFPASFMITAALAAQASTALHVADEQTR